MKMKRYSKDNYIRTLKSCKWFGPFVYKNRNKTFYYLFTSNSDPLLQSISKFKYLGYFLEISKDKIVLAQSDGLIRIGAYYIFENDNTIN